ncbi:PREDICTED: uncharacterized protein LOC105460217 isoform X1 [Wasmannia auropunctata]|uniref:uncharacterized protein LOC105460217 isoform X1 n=1 Tax=Wasmannia auropunctata TaxID=64793 RepID=UPI0005EFB670|nr:PREDICTED: uncharacterized protein LOC105460217 isoform X1 [Wasmannia auropunctata]
MSDATEFIIKTLKKWGLEKWSFKFLEQEISPSLLLSISDEMLIELIPTVGARCTFIEKRKQYLEQQSAKNISSNESVTTDSITDSYQTSIENTCTDIDKERSEQEKESKHSYNNRTKQTNKIRRSCMSKIKRSCD